MKKLDICIIHAPEYLAFLLFEGKIVKGNVLILHLPRLESGNIKDYYYG